MAGFQAADKSRSADRWRGRTGNGMHHSFAPIPSRGRLAWPGGERDAFVEPGRTMNAKMVVARRAAHIPSAAPMHEGPPA